jgi:hypothetical protein
LPNSLSTMEAINVKRATAFVSARLSSARSK